MISIKDRRQMIERTTDAANIVHQCELLGLARSTLYYTPSRAYCERDLRMMEELDKLHLQDPTRGTRRMRNELVKRGFKVGRCHVRTLMNVMRIKTVYCRPRTTLSDPTKYKYPYLLRNLCIERPNQVWSMDITYIPMPKGFMYLTAIIDIYSRYIVGWSISNSMDAAWVAGVVRQAIQTHGKPGILNSDQGTQFTSDCYIDFIKSLKTVKISMDGKGRALDNVYIERFWRTIKYDKLYLERPENGKELNRACREFITYYNHRRDHSSLNNRPPACVYQMAA